MTARELRYLSPRTLLKLNFAKRRPPENWLIQAEGEP
jgi:hypothetical protein